VQRTVVITGAAHGIGRAVAEACAARGDALHLLDLDAERLEQVATALGAAGSAVLDVADPDAVEAAAHTAQQTHGRLDLVVHAAGVSAGGLALRTSAADHRWVLEVNLLGSIAVATSFARLLVAQPTGGQLVLTGSEHSLGVPHLRAASYTASKHGVLGFADVLRRELPDTVGVSVLCPGLVATDLWEAGTRRPNRYGGPVAPGPAGSSVMDAGMPAAEVAAAVLAGAERRDFLILTHGHVGAYAEARFRDVEAAVAAQVPDRDDRYEVTAVIERLRGQGTPGA
jgi:NAD(P)-dependent dehydrogenase (short-subunit alcohol dehydrogenase family)